MTSTAAEIWKDLPPKQRHYLFYVAEISIDDVLDLGDDTDEDRTYRAEAEARAGLSGDHGPRTARSEGAARSALVIKGLLKLEPYEAYLRPDHYALTPLGRRVIRHVGELLRGKTTRRATKKSTEQLDAEIAEALAKEKP